MGEDLPPLLEVQIVPGQIGLTFIWHYIQSSYLNSHKYLCTEIHNLTSKVFLNGSGSLFDWLAG